MRRAERVALGLLVVLALAVVLVPALASRDPLRIDWWHLSVGMLTERGISSARIALGATCSCG